jgi:hypothetical protein
MDDHGTMLLGQQAVEALGAGHGAEAGCLEGLILKQGAKNLQVGLIELINSSSFILVEPGLPALEKAPQDEAIGGWVHRNCKQPA